MGNHSTTARLPVRQVSRRARRQVRRVVAWAVVATLGTVLVVAVLLPRLAGGTPYVILTGSMRPALPPGTLVVTRPVAAGSLEVGQVITYQLVSGRPAVVTHRIVELGVDLAGERVVRTRGDANPTTDAGWVRPVQVRGARWYAVPYVGYLSTWITRTDRSVVERGLEGLLLGYAAWMLSGSVRDRRAAAVRMGVRTAAVPSEVRHG